MIRIEVLPYHPELELVLIPFGENKALAELKYGPFVPLNPGEKVLQIHDFEQAWFTYRRKQQQERKAA